MLNYLKDVHCIPLGQEIDHKPGPVTVVGRRPTEVAPSCLPLEPLPWAESLSPFGSDAAV